MDQPQRESARRRTAELAAERYRKMPAWAPGLPVPSSEPKRPKPIAVPGYELYLAAKEAAALQWVGDGLDSPDSPF